MGLKYADFLIPFFIENEYMYFLATDITDILGHTNTYNAVRNYWLQDYPYLTICSVGGV